MKDKMRRTLGMWREMRREYVLGAVPELGELSGRLPRGSQHVTHYRKRVKVGSCQSVISLGQKRLVIYSFFAASAAQ